MSKIILVISSSPRKESNSEMLCDRFIEGAQQAGHYTEKILLKDYNIGYCVGCGYCLKSGGVCAKKDDMNWILEKMHQADVIVLATPVYKSCMCAQLKTLIDRMFAGNSTLINKEFYFIAAAAASKSAIESTMESMRGCTFALRGSKIKGEIYGANAVGPSDIKSSPAMDEAYHYGLRA